MNNANSPYTSINELRALIKNKDLSPVEITEAYLNRIGNLNDLLGAYITVMSDSALSSAKIAEQEIIAGRYRGPMHGIPIAIKDIIYTEGVRTTAGSRVLSDHVPEADSNVLANLYNAGAILLGKLNLSEFAIGGTIDHPFGTPRNPWNTECTAGGSSSGSGVAAAAGLCAGALGSDTGGSIRGPASFCGLVGMRPTYGRVTRHNVVPMSWSLDTVGPMTRTVKDCAILLGAIAGFDPFDDTSVDVPVPDYLADIDEGVDSIKIGLVKEMFQFEGLDKEVKKLVLDAVTCLEDNGAVVEEVSIPSTADSGAVFIATADVDAAAYHHQWLVNHGELYDWSTRVRLESATVQPAWAYINGQRLRSIIRREMKETLQKYDVVIMPTGPVPAPTIEASTGKPGGYYQGRLDLARRRYTSPAPLAELPAISVPCGFSESGLPVGMQIVGRAFDEKMLLRVSQSYEKETDWHNLHPSL